MGEGEGEGDGVRVRVRVRVWGYVVRMKARVVRVGIK